MTEYASLPAFNDRYLEDYHAGDVFDLGSITVDGDEIIAFARRYDPQPIHIDPEAAARSPFGGLIASGWMTGGLFMRLLVEHYIPGKASLGSPGMEDLRWVRPVRPGDTLHGKITVLDARRSKSKPDRGVVTSASEVTNQNGEVVMTLKATNMFLARGPA